MPKEAYRGPLFYKFLKAGGAPPVARTRMLWDLPTFAEGVWIPGKWKVLRPPIYVCSRGLHASPADQVWRYTADELYEVEYDDRPFKSTNWKGQANDWEKHHVFDWSDDRTKVAGRKARLTRRIMGWDERSQTELARVALRAANDLAHKLELPEHYIEIGERRVADPNLFCTFDESMEMGVALERPHPDMIKQGPKADLIRRYRQIVQECRPGGWYMWIVLGYLRLRDSCPIGSIPPSLDRAVLDFFPNLIAAERPT